MNEDPKLEKGKFIFCAFPFSRLITVSAAPCEKVVIISVAYIDDPPSS
jgi:hypothetical protein